MSGEFNYVVPTKLHFGVDILTQCGSLISGLGKRALLVTMKVEPFMEPSLAILRSSLKEAGFEVHGFEGAIPNPTLASVEKGSQLARDLDIDVVIGFGGGSAMDTAKAIAVGATHEGSLWNYIWSSDTQPTDKTLPIVAIPTTSGTGSQLTQVSVFTNEDLKYKAAIYNELIFPAVAIVDPRLMVTTPKAVTAATGFDVFTHAFESYIHSNSSPIVKTLAKQAIAIVGQYLPVVLEDPHNIEARTQMAFADSLAGMCIANAGVTLPHGMGMAIGGFYPNISHGQALAIVYPEFVKFTESAAPEAFEMLRNALAPEASSPLEAIEVFLSKVGLNKKLSDFGATSSDVSALTEQCMVLPDYQANPRVTSSDEMRAIIEAVL
ncbi:iron-containing alcohol dehydrogenase [Cohaesibacter celericrescens]|uniref:Alcohol dehydrogenase n=1 Tax=Cohaesibacter celericrescens TaxID=2067669 RepID=A0A2N5XV35_9HYPH|nr:iron-containing alcohol dehydrogenase [Cohaesibacter celericrescens]PLW78317.1 alcohol dehydrogenase [Cohaesibacter celericrescens]